MRRTDREISDFSAIVDILRRCDTLHVGMNGADGVPYVVPLSFGFCAEDGRLTLYVHGAKDGLRHRLLARDGRVCVEASVFGGYRESGGGTTTSYESVIGFGTMELCGHAEAVKGLACLMEHCHVSGYSPEDCLALGITSVWRIAVEQISGKRNLP